MVMLPSAFCWTRMGIEAGQSLASILERKNEERQANDGLFFWGIGNAVGPSISELIKRCPQPEVIFSPIKTSARGIDVNPANVVAWTAAESLDGTTYPLPLRALITSKLASSNPRAYHYALVCSTNVPLTEKNESGTIEIGELENLRTGKPIGASQVTAVVRRVEHAYTPIRTYRILLRTKLSAPFFLRLRNPIPLPKINPMQSWERTVRRVWGELQQESQAD